MRLPTHDCAVFFAVSQHQLPSNTLLVTAVTKRSIYISEVLSPTFFSFFSLAVGCYIMFDASVIFLRWKLKGMSLER